MVIFVFIFIYIWWSLLETLGNISSLKKEGSHKKCYPHFLVHILMFTHTDINILFSWKEEAWEQRCWGALFRKKGENLSSWWHHTATELNSGSAWPLQSLLYEILIFSHWIGIFFPGKIILYHSVVFNHNSGEMI